MSQQNVDLEMQYQSAQPMNASQAQPSNAKPEQEVRAACLSRLYDLSNKAIGCR